MARTHERIFAGFFAGLFLVSSLAAGIWVVYNGVTNKDSDPAAASQQSTNQTENKNMLQGTKLANFTPVADVPTLQSTDTTPGTGAEVKAGDTITFDYTGALASDGTIFQSSLDTGKTATYPLTSLIEGWQKGIPGMKVGGTRRLLIPSAQGYGSSSQPGIPANSDLVFDITVHSVGQ